MNTTIKSMFRDIGFEWGLQKCAVVEVKRGKPTEGGNLIVSKEESVQIMLRMTIIHFSGPSKIANSLKN